MASSLRTRTRTRDKAAALAFMKKAIALLDLTFKPNTDAMRDAPSVAIATALAHAGVTVARARSRWDLAGKGIDAPPDLLCL